MPYRDLIWKLTEKTKELYPKKEYPKSIVIDTETTGLDPFHDELLQVSIIDEEGNVLLTATSSHSGTKNGQKQKALIISRLNGS